MAVVLTSVKVKNTSWLAPMVAAHRAGGDPPAMVVTRMVRFGIAPSSA